jgi:hypothetical protein
MVGPTPEQPLSNNNNNSNNNGTDGTTSTKKRPPRKRNNQRNKPAEAGSGGGGGSSSSSSTPTTPFVSNDGGGSGSGGGGGVFDFSGKPPSPQGVGIGGGGGGGRSRRPASNSKSPRGGGGTGGGGDDVSVSSKRSTASSSRRHGGNKSKYASKKKNNSGNNNHNNGTRPTETVGSGGGGVGGTAALETPNGSATANTATTTNGLVDSTNTKGTEAVATGNGGAEGQVSNKKTRNQRRRLLRKKNADRLADIADSVVNQEPVENKKNDTITSSTRAAERVPMTPFAALAAGSSSSSAFTTTTTNAPTPKDVKEKPTAAAMTATDAVLTEGTTPKSKDDGKTNEFGGTTGPKTRKQRRLGRKERAAAAGTVENPDDMNGADADAAGVEEKNGSATTVTLEAAALLDRLQNSNHNASIEKEGSASVDTTTAVLVEEEKNSTLNQSAKDPPLPESVEEQVQQDTQLSEGEVRLEKEILLLVESSSSSNSTVEPAPKDTKPASVSVVVGAAPKSSEAKAPVKAENNGKRPADVYHDSDAGSQEKKDCECALCTIL